MPPPEEGFAARFVLGPALRAQPDRRLVTLVREGYENAFEEIVRRYGRPLTRYAAAIAGSRAEDITQDAFSKALLALRRDEREIELRPWLFRIVRNTALNDLRDRPPSAELLAEAIAGGGNPEEELERREELVDLMRRLQALPEAQRAAIVMRELEGLSHEEIASALGLSGGAARQAIFRARRALRDGAGMLLPLPLLKALLATPATAPLDVAAGAAGIGGATGAGVAIKAATATVLVAGAVGAGVAIDHHRHVQQPEPAQASAIAEDSTAGNTSSASNRGAETGSSSGSSASGDAEPGGDQGGERHSSQDEDHHHPGDDGGGQGSGDNDHRSDRNDSSGQNSGRHTEPGEDHGGEGASSGRGEAGGDDSGHRSGRDSGGSSGPGSGGSSGSGGGDSPGDGGDSFDSSNSGPGSGSTSPNEGSGEESGSGSGSGDEGPDHSGGGDSSSSGGSGDSGGGDGFSEQTQPPS